jgi:hypothetical protein
VTFLDQNGRLATIEHRVNLTVSTPVRVPRGSFNKMDVLGFSAQLRNSHKMVLKNWAD